MRLRIIFNPRSGRPRRKAPILPQLRDFLAARNLDADLICTEGPGHATELAREAVRKGVERVVAVGGDGTVNEVAQALIHTPSALGLVPCGSGNGLALHLGLPRSLTAALDLASSPLARVAEIDTGLVNGRTFVNAMGMGLDADVSRRFNHLTKRGLPAYARTAMAAFFHRKTVHAQVTTGGRRESVDALIIAVANSDQYGNNAKIAPRACVDDGALDLVLVSPVGLFGAALLGVGLFAGTLDRSRAVRRIRGERFLIERPDADVIHTDGETHPELARLEVSVRPRSLRIAVSHACTAVGAAEASKAAFALQIP